MKHRFLHPVDPGTHAIPVCYDHLQAWTDNLPNRFANPILPQPKAALLCGMPGVGKGIAVKSAARTLQRPLVRLDPACDATGLAEVIDVLDRSQGAAVLWIDQPQATHAALHRWLLDTATPPAFVVFTTTAPQQLPVGFTRADVVATAWHLDLPDTRQRSTLWGELLATAHPGHHEHDSVQLGQLSPRFTVGEIHAAFANASGAADGLPNRHQLIDAVLDLKPLAVTMDEHLACLRHWALPHARPAAAVNARPEW